MKKIIFISMLLLFIISHVRAQEKVTRHMVITIIDEHIAFTIGSKVNNMFITRDDTAQLEKVVDLNPHVKMRDAHAAYERLLMKLIQPYFDQGWQLVSTSAEAADPNPPTETFRYYFTK